MGVKISKIRRTLQWAWFSKCGVLQPSLLINSIPKSGTHLAKAILEGAGCRYAGHVGASELKFLKNKQMPKQVFMTAHISEPVKIECQKVLIFRDPIDVAVSMAIYIRSRKDHPRQRLFSEMSLIETINAIFSGFDELEPLAVRFDQMYKWAVSSQAQVINFSEIKKNPKDLLNIIGLDYYDEEKIDQKVHSWNPTKRTKPVANEFEIKDKLRRTNEIQVVKAVDVYQKIKSLT